MDETKTNDTSETTAQRTHLRMRTGTVEAISGIKTIRVGIETLVRHAQYGKYLRRRTRLAVDDPENTAKVGDVVEIAPCRPVSKRKAWRLVRVIRSVDNPLAAASAQGE